MKKKNPEQKSGNHGCLFFILGILCVILGTVGFVFLIGRMTSVLITARYGGQAAYAIMTAQVPCIVIASFLMNGILIMEFLPSAEEYEKKRTLRPGEKPRKLAFLGTRKASHMVSAILLLGILICGIVALNTYRVVGEDGITDHCFVDTATHKWEDVTAYRIACDSDKGLSVTFTMADGKQYEILRGTVADTALFAETYGTATAFAAHIGQMMDETGIPRNISRMETAVKFYRYDYPDLWPYVKELIRYEEIKPGADEVVTEAIAESETTEPGAS